MEVYGVMDDIGLCVVLLCYDTLNFVYKCCDI